MAKSARCYEAELFYDVVKSKRHWLAVTLSFTPCGNRQTDFYYIEEISLALYTALLMLITLITVITVKLVDKV